MKHSMMRPLALLTSLVALSACGGGAGTSMEVPAGSAAWEATSFEEIDARADSLMNRFRDSKFTSVEDLPATGRASYVGAAGYVEGDVDDFDPDRMSEEDVVLASQMRMNANFSDGSIDGAFTNFHGRDVPYGVNGRIDIRDGRIEGGMIEGKLDGALSSPRGSVTVDGDLRGAFLEAGARGVVGGMDMTVTSDQRGESIDVFGAFAGERD